MKNNKQSGLIMVGIVLGIGMFALGIAILVVSATTSSLVKNNNSKSGNLSFITAESALREGVHQLLHDIPNYTGGVFPLINNSNGNLITVNDLGSYKYEVLGEAHSNTTTREILYIINTFPASAIFDHAIYAQNTLNLAGNANITGSVFANNTIDLQDSGLTLDGNVYSATSINGHTETITGNQDENVVPVEPPSVDVQHYIDNATMTFTSSADAESYLSGNNISNEIIYISDTSNTTNINGGATFSGTLIAEGDLVIKKTTISQGDPLGTGENDPLVIYVKGDLSLDTLAVINGVIFIEGALLESAGTPIVNGSIIAASGTSDVDLTGTIDINYVENNWENISLDMSTGGSPTVSGWSE